MLLVMMMVLCCCAALPGPAAASDELREAVLQKLGLAEEPRVHRRDLENLVVPAHVRTKYLSMLKLHHQRRRRSLPSLAGILRGIPGNADISGEFVYSDATRQRMVFDMEARIPDNSEVTMAELKLYKKAPRRHAMAEKKNHRPVSNARVSVYWVDVLENGSNRTSIVDSRLIPIHETGWISFDVTQAVHYWAKTHQKTPMHLEVWIEGERPGSYAAEMAKSVHFATQDGENAVGRPELVLYTLNLEEFGASGDCESNKDKDTCCREKYFINFRALTWTQYWIIEPAGYQAFRCTGSCRQPKRTYGYGERKCAVVESAPLPMMYLVKKGDYTEIEVAEFPNMIVEKCGCAMDNVLVV
ncbi:lefty1 [Denticeps clupeoides]|uniref:TGF-beta family profile domain-containing protein n=1 Tax=Denticeps clupeoides TaxID=299321 RepID=A0AAY4EUU9_9TELE|nr:left-right determination factor 2-like [Denticeps clupeoides]